MKSILVFAAAAVAEIGGCYAFWLSLRSGRSAAWMLAGTASLIAFAWLLTRVEINFAGRAYAAYGGIYITASLLWLWAVEGERPDKWGVTGVGICLVGVGVIVFARRST